MGNKVKSANVDEFITPEKEPEQPLKDIKKGKDPQYNKDKKEDIYSEKSSISISKNLNVRDSPAGIKTQQFKHSIAGGNFNKLTEWLKKTNNENIILTKIYTATNDGDTKLHTFIDNKGPTVMVISANGRLFGGYTSLSWNTNGAFRTDREAFLFSITDNYKLPIDQGKNYWAIYAVNGNYTYFGYPSDLIIQNKFLTASNNTSDNKSGTYPSNSSQVFLAGQKLFKIDELEVFTVEKF